jgi:hypothetical protein
LGDCGFDPWPRRVAPRSVRGRARGWEADHHTSNLGHWFGLGDVVVLDFNKDGFPCAFFCVHNG